MRKSIRRKIATILTLFGIINSKAKAASKAQIAGYCAVALGVFAAGGYCLFGGKSSDDNGEDKFQQQKNLENSIKDFLDCLPKDNKKLLIYLKIGNVSDKNKESIFGISKSVFDNYLNRKAGYTCISSEQDIKNNKLIIKHPDGTDVFIFEDGINLKIQQNCVQRGINKQFNIMVSKPSRNPNKDDPLKNKIKNILDNGKLIDSKVFDFKKLKCVYDTAYNNNGFYQFDESISEKSAVSVVQCWFSEDGETVTKKVTYKFILDNDKQVRIQKFIFEAGKEEKMDCEGIITVS